MCLALLHVLDFLQMKDIRKAAVHTLRNRELKPAEKLYLMRMSEVDFDKPWASDAVLDLCLRFCGPGAGEGRMIGWDVFAMIWEVREEIREGNYLSSSQPSEKVAKALKERDAGLIFGNSVSRTRGYDGWAL